MVTQSSVSNYIHTKISFDSGTKVAVVTQYRISYYFHATVSFNCGTKVAVVTRYQLPNYFHITIYPLTPLHKSSPPPSAFQFLFLHTPSIEVTKVTESQNSNYIHTTCHVCSQIFPYFLPSASHRDALHYQNGWFFVKVPNGLWPPPLIFGKSCCNFFSEIHDWSIVYNDKNLQHKFLDWK